MSQNIVSKELAIMLKEVGYDKQCTHCYMHGRLENDNLLWQYEVDDCFVLAPSLHDVTDWLREMYGLHIGCICIGGFYGCEIQHVKSGLVIVDYEATFPEYTDAIFAAITHALQLLTDKMEGK